MNVPAELLAVMSKWGIDTPLEKAHFLAQCAAETQGFTKYAENMNYTSAERILSVFKKRITKLSDAMRYVKNPQALANRVYANRYGNRSEASGDGFRFRGSGFVHLTFFDNYLSASMAIYGDDRLVKNPELARKLDVAADIAGWYWKSRKCDIPANHDNIDAVTQAINGGDNGLLQRKNWLKYFKKELGI